MFVQSFEEIKGKLSMIFFIKPLIGLDLPLISKKTMPFSPDPNYPFTIVVLFFFIFK